MWSLPVVLAGIVYAATLTLFVLSTKLTTAANAIFLQSTAPLYLLLLGPLLLSEHFKRRDVIYLLAVALGMLSCFMDGRTRRSLRPIRDAEIYWP